MKDNLAPPLWLALRTMGPPAVQCLRFFSFLSLRTLSVITTPGRYEFHKLQQQMQPTKTKSRRPRHNDVTAIHLLEGAAIESSAMDRCDTLRQADNSSNVAPRRSPFRIIDLSLATLFKWASAMVLALGVFPGKGLAHVKWFAPYDVTEAPTSIGGVLTPHFLLACAGFSALLIGAFSLDSFVTTRLPIIAMTARNEDLEERLLRAGTGAFFMALFAAGGVLLTPELRTDADWPAWLQLGIAISMFSGRTSMLGAVGILVLYVYGVFLYGAFHLSDYPMFIGLALYFSLASLKSGRLRSKRMLVLHVSLCITLMWGAVEKWAYPQWTFPLLAARPYLTFGLPPQDFMVVAGFVEFAFAFYMLTGRGLLRIAILGLGTIFAAAIIDFGKIDAIGHLPFLTTLVAMFLHGPTQLQVWLNDNSDSLLRKARTTSFAFATALLVFFFTYYGLQYAEYGHGSFGRLIALFVSTAHAH